ncbi:MAG: CHASE2 domain-containing protein, partial [Acidobacteriota bacterium]|nr:CHASE2 domain-containing protein [Acidobacteriota bacterium]
MAAILLVSATAGLLVDWNAPGIGRYAHDWMMRERGTLPAPGDIAIVAIDEPSIARFGRFPWNRQVVAHAIDALAAARPKAIGLDILFTDHTSQEDDDALARSIGRAGNVVVAAQLTASPVHGGPSRWLLPLPSLERAAAGIGHVNVQTEQDGAARQVAVRLADDSGRALLAMPVEIVRVADNTSAEGITDAPGALLLGPRTVQLETVRPGVQLEAGAARVLHGGRMNIDYIGPAGSFAPVTYSLADVLAGHFGANEFGGKYVLLGATAASLGERLANPFVRYTDARADQHGELMPGVEVLANALNTILRSRYYSDTGDFGSFTWAAAIAALTLLLLEAAQGGREFFRQILVLGGMSALIVFGGRALFQYALIVPPIVPCLVAFAVAGILGLLRRSLVASARLDSDIAQLAVSGDLLAPAGPGIPGTYHWGEGGPVTLARGWLPKGVEWKARTLSELNARLLDRAKFVNFALRSVEDGLLIADPSGVITFANRSAGAILGSAARGLVGQDLAQRLHGAVDAETLNRLVAERGRLEREIALRDGSKPRHFMLRVAAVSVDEKNSGSVLGIVASLSDVTRQHELQQTKNDVISLVSHEMRTPLTAIQGMTELLANYDVPAGRRKEMNLAINDEVKRLTRMIGQYLDITRLESGATAMRPAAVRADALLERSLLLLDPVAGQRRIRLLRNFAPDLPPFLADPDLLSRAFENLVSNAIKYS